MKNAKHAYLIMAHNNFSILEKLIKLLDDKRNDIYIHIDKKVSHFDFNYFKQLTQKSNIHFVKRMNVQWGGYSQIKGELTLLKSAVSRRYEYYHYISGVDLPLKTQDYIHEFFEQNSGKEFIHFDKQENDIGNYDRIRYYHLLQELIHGSKTKAVSKTLRILNRGILAVEKICKVNRMKNNELEYQKGASWFSITDSLAKYILSKEDLIKKMFNHTNCGDELFLQTLVWNSEYRTRLYNDSFNNNYQSCMRYIDWNRGQPYVWRVNDYNKLMNTEYLFARKFDINTDFSIVEKIYDYLKNNQQQAMT
jgi:hypothetical protein